MSSHPLDNWKAAVSTEYARRTRDKLVVSGNDFPLIASTIFKEEIIAAVNSVLNGQLTMSSHVREFEELFARKIRAPFAVMCNSGSSANLLALSAATNHLRSHRLSPGDEVLLGCHLVLHPQPYSTVWGLCNLWRDVLACHS